MSSAFSVFAKRLQIIVVGGTARLLATLSSVVISILIVRTQSPSLWGEVIPFMLIIEFGFSVIGWGALPFLVQQFSLHPHQAKSDWGEATFSRSWLLLLFLIVIPLLSFSVALKIYMMVWATGRFVYQCFEPIAQTERNFLFSIIMEFTALMIIAVPVIMAETPIQVEDVVLLFAASMFWRASVSAIFFRKWISFQTVGAGYFKRAFPFFLLTLSGMMQQRTDLYCVTFFLNDKDTAVYQVFFNFLVFCQFLASLLLSPFAKNIFRLSPRSLSRLERKYMLAGLPLALGSIAAVFVAIRYFYHFELSWAMYGLGYLYIFMFYLYLLRNYEMGKAYRQTTVAIYGFLGSFLNLILCTLLIPSFGIEGALLSGTAAQAFIVMLFHRKKASEYAKG